MVVDRPGVNFSGFQHRSGPLYTYHGDIIQKPLQVSNYVINIDTTVHESKSLGVRELPNDIESIVLKPDPKIACAFTVRVSSEPFLQLLKERDGSRVDQRLEGN